MFNIDYLASTPALLRSQLAAVVNPNQRLEKMHGGHRMSDGMMATISSNKDIRKNRMWLMKRTHKMLGKKMHVMTV